MTSAFYLAKAFPHSSITLYEKNDYAGGWLKTMNYSKIKKRHPRTIELGAKLVKNDINIGNFYELCDYLEITKDLIPCKQNVT